MSREIKFRAWDIHFKRWFFKGFSVCESGEQIFDEDEHYYNVGEDVILNQFVGRKDKKGQDIYEEDIVKYINAGELQYRSVFWSNEDGAWLTKNVHFTNDQLLLGIGYLLTNGLVEVIGNTYQHLELLKH